MRSYFCSNYHNAKIKVVAFDFDETFYKSDNMKALYLNYIFKTFKVLCGFDDNKIKTIMNELGYTLESKIAPSFSQICTQFGVSEEEYHNYRIENFFEIDYDKAEVVGLDVLKRFKEKFKVYIVSNEIDKLFYNKMNKLKISPDLFDGIYCTPIDAMKTKNKKEAYYDILKKNNCFPENLVVVGDRFKVDIEPALSLGASGFLVDGPKEIEKILSLIITGYKI